jgi:hypothetical protein
VPDVQSREATLVVAPGEAGSVPNLAADAEPCSCCDLPWYSCGKQLERQQRDVERAERERAMHLPGVIASRFPGECICGERFSKDAPIRKRQDGWQSVLCCGLADL